VDGPKTRTWANFRLQRGLIESDAVDESQAPASQPPDPGPRTFFEPGAIFEGTFKLSGDFRIDSEFRGDLSTDGLIVVGPSGSVEGNIEARQVEIEGAVVGNVTTRRMLILRASGRLHGDVETACLEIERHAFFQGGTKMIHPLSTSRPRIETDGPNTGATRSAAATASPFVPS
jgi:cytoskeletal protein CcmA (bactofilin family)